MERKQDALEFDTARKVLALANRIVTSRNRHLKELGLTAEQADTLLFLASRTDATATDLKDFLQIRHQTARGILLRLVEKDMVYLTQSAQDARAKNAKLTEKGLRVMAQLRENGTHTGYHLLQDMTEEERRQFYVLVTKALKNI